MATLNGIIYTTLRDDVTLRALLGKEADPYGIYHLSPPKKPSFPLISYFINAQVSNFPRQIPFMVTTWGGLIAIKDRVFTLLHDKTIATATDYGFLLIRYDGSSSEMFDENFKIEFRQDRFLATGIRKI